MKEGANIRNLKQRKKEEIKKKINKNEQIKLKLETLCESKPNKRKTENHKNDLLYCAINYIFNQYI